MQSSHSRRDDDPVDEGSATGGSSIAASVAAFELVGLPAAVLARPARLLATNARFGKLVPHVVAMPRGSVALVDAAAQARFEQALADVAAGRPRAAVPIPARRTHPPVVLHVIALPATGPRALKGAHVLLVATVLMRKQVLNVEALQTLFGLTPAEARVARAVVEGRTVDTMATAFGLSRETVRSQLKAVLAKAGVARQGDLAVLLAGSALPGSGE
jgi:DNA-binding CsgD family transcriptional regulator